MLSVHEIIDMTPQERIEFEMLRNIVMRLVRSDRYSFEKDIQIADGRNVQTGRGVGTIFGSAADQKIGFFGKAPVVQQGSIAAPSGGATIDTQARSAISSALDVLDALGFTA